METFRGTLRAKRKHSLTMREYLFIGIAIELGNDFRLRHAVEDLGLGYRSVSLIKKELIKKGKLVDRKGQTEVTKNVVADFKKPLKITENE